MKTQNETARRLARASTKPDLDALRDELAVVLGQAGTIRDRQVAAMNTRQNIWEGQSADYRKHEKDLGEPARPYEGAPDMRVPVVDTVVRERVALYVEALMSGDIQAVPLPGLAKAEDATKMSRVLSWLRDNQLQAELRQEAELLANYIEGDDPGVGFLKVWWKREAGLELRQLDLNDIGEALLGLRGIELDENGAPPPGTEGIVDDIGDLIYNPLREAEALSTLALAYPTVQPRRLRKSLRELQRTGTTKLPVPYVKENRPCVAALRYMEDLFCLEDLDDVQRGRVIYERERVTESELRMRLHTDDYRPGFIQKLLDAGPGDGDFDAGGLRTADWSRTDGRSVDNETENLYELWHAYSRAADDYGIQGVYWTVFSAKVDDDYGYHDLLDYPHGNYPLIDFRSEFISRGIKNARGTPARVGSLQYEIKMQRDCRGAHTQMATIPPVRVAQRRGGLEAVLGPMVEVPVREADDVTWMTPPPFPQSSLEMEKSSWNDLNQYLGRIMPGVPADMAQNLLQFEVNRWLDRWKLVWSQIQQLQERFGSPEQMALVAGGPMPELTPAEIRGRFTTKLTFSVRDLNMEFVISRNNAIAAVLQQDSTGVVDRVPIVRAGLRAVDPSLADAIRDTGAVTMAEVRDQQDRVAKMAVGIQPPMRQTGINAALRMDALQKTVMGSPQLAQRFMQPATPEDQYFRKLVEEEQKNLQFLVDQYQNNPLIGKQGTIAEQPVAAAQAGSE